MSNRVLPILRLAVLCEQVGTDDEDRPYFCVPVHTIRFPPGVTRHFEPPTLHVYAQLQEALGTFNLKVVLRREREDIDLWSCSLQPVDFTGDTFERYQNVPMELDLVLNGLVIPEPGVYELWVVANHVNLHNPDRQPGWPFPPMRLTAFGPDGTPGGVV